MRYPRTLACANQAICDELENPTLTQDERHELALIHCHHISDEEAREGRNGHVIAARALQREFLVEILRAADGGQFDRAPEPDFENYTYDGTPEDWEARR